MRRVVYLAGLILVLVAQPSSGRMANSYSVNEYGLLIIFPSGARVCQSLTGDHLHGWWTPLSGTCKHSSRGINVLANWNAAFLRTPAEATYCEGGSLKKGAALKLAFPGRRSATCFEAKRNGEILVTVTTQAWRWPDANKSNDPDWRDSAWVNYDAYLSTNRASFARDLRQFKSVLQKVQIRRPR